MRGLAADVERLSDLGPRPALSDRLGHCSQLEPTRETAQCDDGGESGLWLIGRRERPLDTHDINLG